MVCAQYVDPNVSRAKFDREITEFQALEDQHRKRGWLLVRAEFPNVLVLLATAKTVPISIVMGVAFDYSNYDAAPPSVRLVHPLSGVPYQTAQLPTALNRTLPSQPVSLQGQAPGVGLPQIVVMPQQSLMQSYGPDEIPFLCLAGVREYHEHPAHSGDLWELHRTSGAGRLVRLLEIISKYGVDPITGFSVQLKPMVGFNFGQPPA